VERIARERTLLVFDFDGTLAPIVPRRQDAQLRPETRRLLRTAALLYPCAVVSGRALFDLRPRLDGIPLAGIVGCHGAEPGFGPLDPELERAARTHAAALRRALDGVAGVEVEDKRLGVAVHYRASASWPEAEAAVLAAATRLSDARVLSGHAVVNVLPAGAPSKADAIRALCARLRAAFPLYVGDDRSDEDAFRCEAVGISVQVGRAADSAARWFVPDQAAIDELLRILIAARARQDGLAAEGDRLVRLVGA
jgi:trehalose 6-phosphate phosphatase